MQNQFVQKITGQGEEDISKLSGFRQPEEKEREAIKEKVEKNTKKEIASAVFWAVVSSFFVGMYLFLFFFGEGSGRRNMLLMAVVFLAFDAACGYKAGRCMAFRNIIRKEDYQLREVTIHHLMPRLAYLRGTAKVKDENETVYHYEFELNRKQMQAFEKDKNTAFLLLKTGQEKAEYILISKIE